MHLRCHGKGERESATSTSRSFQSKLSAMMVRDSDPLSFLFLSLSLGCILFFYGFHCDRTAFFFLQCLPFPPFFFFGGNVREVAMTVTFTDALAAFVWPKPFPSPGINWMLKFNSRWNHVCVFFFFLFGTVIHPTVHVLWLEGAWNFGQSKWLDRGKVGPTCVKWKCIELTIF